MFFNIGGAEILVIAIVALVAVGPEQLPTVLRKVGRFVAQARSMTAALRDEFMSGLDDVKEVTSANSWLKGSGGDDDPIVPRGVADRANGGATPSVARTDEQVAPVADLAELDPSEPDPPEPDRFNPEPADLDPVEPGSPQRGGARARPDDSAGAGESPFEGTAPLEREAPFPGPPVARPSRSTGVDDEEQP